MPKPKAEKKTKQDLIDYLSALYTNEGVEAVKNNQDKHGHVKRLSVLLGMLRKGWYDSYASPLEEDNFYFLAKALDEAGLGLTAHHVREGLYEL